VLVIESSSDLFQFGLDHNPILAFNFTTATSTETTMRKELVGKKDRLEALLKDRDAKVEHPYKNTSILNNLKQIVIVCSVSLTIRFIGEQQQPPSHTWVTSSPLPTSVIISKQDVK